MDEPTSSLTLQRPNRLLELVCELSEQGVSVIYISHRLGEVDECADRVVVLRDGKNAGELPATKSTHDNIVSLMVGREIKNFYVESEAPKTPGYFKVRNVVSSRYIPKRQVSFEPRKGEILGFAGLVGAGRSEMAKAIVGLDACRVQAKLTWMAKTISDQFGRAMRSTTASISCPKIVAAKGWSPT